MTRKEADDWLIKVGAAEAELKKTISKHVKLEKTLDAKSAAALAATDRGLKVSLAAQKQAALKASYDNRPAVTEPIRKQARKDFPTQFDIFANLWLTAATDALAGAPEAEDEESTANWWVALAGNLMWAATCLVPGGAEVSLLVKIMSFGGAAIGSGVIAKPGEKAPSGRELVGEILADARDAMVDKAGSIMDEAATECGDRQITDLEEQKKVLWGKLFKKKYDFDKAGPIQKDMSAKIKGGLASYLKQWHQWQDDTEREARSLAVDDEVMTNDMDSSDYIPDWHKYLEKVSQAKPFRPQLSFD